MVTRQQGNPFSGARVGKGDARYHALSMGFNQRFVGRPAYINVVGSTDQVVDAVQEAVDNRLRITVRGGGHCYEGFVSDNTDGVIIDVSPLSAVAREPDGTYCLGAGCTNWNVYEQLYKRYGVTLPAGSCYSVGLGGHVCGGGYGMMSRTFGLVVDYLAAVEVVTVGEDGRARVVRATADDPDTASLFWAHTGGGGGNFGVITRYWFVDPPTPPPMAWISSVAWPWTDLVRGGRFARLLHNFGKFMAGNSSNDSVYRDMFAILALKQWAGQEVVLTTQYTGEGRGPLDEFVAAVGDGLTPSGPQTLPAGHHLALTDLANARQLPWIQAVQTFDGSGANQRGKYKSAYMIEPFPDGQIDAIFRALTDPAYSNSQALLQVDSYGCRINTRLPTETAVAQRSSIMKLQYQTYWTDPAQDDVHLEWMRKFYRSVYRSSGGEPTSNDVTDGCYVNYPDVDLDNWPELYYKDNYPRLQVVKRQWDPSNVFHHAQSIRA